MMIPFDLSELSDGKVHTLKVVANESDLDIVRERIQPAEITSLTAHLNIQHDAHGRVHIEGQLSAYLVQECGKTLDHVDHTLDVPIEEILLYPGQEADNSSDIEEECLPDFETLENSDSFDVGEFILQHLILAIDPYFVQEGDEVAHREHESTQKSPFAALEALKKKD